MPDFRNIRTLLKEAYRSLGYGADFRDENRQSWTAALQLADYVSFDLTHSACDYYFAYALEGSEAVELSHLVVDEDGPLVLWSMILVTGSDGETSLKTGGHLLQFPVILRTLSDKATRKLVGACYQVLKTISAQSGIKTIDIVESFRGRTSTGIGPWHAFCLDNGAVPTIGYSLYGDLSLSLAAYKTHIRKSYKSLVNKGLATWNIGILKDGEGQALWQSFRQLHLNQAGKATRSDKTWELQEAAIAQGEAFLVHSTDDNGKMVGGAYFATSRDEAYYAVGAYDRTLFDQPIAHALQFTAIEELMRRNVRWYRLGELPFAGQTPSPDKKELDIALFKSGFSTHKILEPALQITVKSDEE